MTGVTVTLAFDRPVSRKQAAEEVRNTLGGVHQCPGDSSDAQSFTAIGFKGAAPAGGLILQDDERDALHRCLSATLCGDDVAGMVLGDKSTIRAARRALKKLEWSKGATT